MASLLREVQNHCLQVTTSAAKSSPPRQRPSVAGPVPQDALRQQPSSVSSPAAPNARQVLIGTLESMPPALVSAVGLDPIAEFPTPDLRGHVAAIARSAVGRSPSNVVPTLRPGRSRVPFFSATSQPPFDASRMNRQTKLPRHQG